MEWIWELHNTVPNHVKELEKNKFFFKGSWDPYCYAKIYIMLNGVVSLYVQEDLSCVLVFILLM